MSEVQDQLDEAQLTYLSVLLDNGYKFLFRTYLFGKSYVWMKAPTGTLFLERIPERSPEISVDSEGVVNYV